MTQVNSFLFNLRHQPVVRLVTPSREVGWNSAILLLRKLLAFGGCHIVKFFLCHGLSHAF